MIVYVLTGHKVDYADIENYVFEKESDAKQMWKSVRQGILDTGRKLLYDYEDDMYFRDDTDYECFVIAHKVM